MEVTEPASEKTYLQEVREQLEHGRREREKRGSIPDTLWEKATSLQHEDSSH